MLKLTYPCTRCGSSATHHFGEQARHGRLSWWESVHCGGCGSCVEADGANRLPDDMRSHMLRSLGVYRVVVHPRDRTGTLLTLRRELGLSMDETRQLFARLPCAVQVGLTRAEALRLRTALLGPAAEVRAEMDAPPADESRTQRELEFHDSKLVGLRQTGDTLVLAFDGHVHRWDRADDRWHGTGWLEPVDLTLSGVDSASGLVSGAEISHGSIVLGDTTLQGMARGPAADRGASSRVGAAMLSRVVLFASLGIAACAAAPTVERTYAPGEPRDVYRLSREDHFPEGAAFDEVSGAFFTGSLAHGDVTRITLEGEETIVHAGGVKSRATLGMAVDAAARHLWVCVLRDEKSKAGSLLKLHIDDGSVVATIPLADALPGASCNDVIVAPDGSAFVTDRENAAIYRVSGVGPAVLWSSHPLLTPDTIGLNGIAITPDGSTMLVTHYKPARLLRIPMADPTDVTEVALRGDAFSGGIHIAAGADGLRFWRDQLYVAFDRFIMQLTKDDDEWRAATVRSFDVPVEYGVTALVVARDELYAVNGQTAMFLLGLDPEPFRLVRLRPEAFER